MNEAVFIVPWPLMASQETRYGFDVLRSSGLKVRVFDLSPLLNAANLSRFPVADLLEGAFVERFTSYAQFERRIRELSLDAVFIDYVLGLANIDAHHHRAYRALKRGGARLFVVYGGGIPPAAGATAGLRLRQLLDPGRLAQAAASRVLAQLRARAGIYPFPEHIFSTHHGIARGFVERWGLPDSTIVRTHSSDYDAYAAYTQANPNLAPDGTCVFLDEAATHHPDAAIVGGRNLERAAYESAMNGLFGKIERQTGLRVVIAAHPRARYDLHPGFFGGRSIHQRRTVELVARSSLVVTHASTSISFAVLFGKPALLVKTPEMVEIGYDRFVDGIARALGVESILLSGDDASEVDFSKGLPSMPSKAEEYRDRYLRSPGVPDDSIWAIVSRHIRDLK